MELKLEVLLSSGIKRRKPWPRFCWLGREKEAVFLLDDNRISEVHLVSGRTKKKTPKLQPLLHRVVTMSGSENGMWLVGLLVSGELFLWNKDKDTLKMVSAVPGVHALASSIKGPGSTVRLSLLVSESGQRVFLAALTGQIFLWECLTPQDLSSPRDVAVKGRWSQISHPEDTRLPSSKDKEASVHSVFVKNQESGDVCLSGIVFSAEGHLIISFLKIQWEMMRHSKLSSVGFTVHWVSKSYRFSQLEPPCRAVKSRGALVPALSPDGQLLAVVLNQKDPRVTQVLFISTQNFVTVSSLLGGCGLKTLNVPDKYVRSYWVGSVSWTPEGLYLACVLKRGSLLLLARLAGLVSLSTTGCNIEFGPAHFLPLHPLVTYRPPSLPHTQDGALSSSSVSLRDPMRQRYSVTCHPRKPFLILSDGYMVTALRLPRRPSAAAVMSALLLEAAQGLENIRRVMGSSQPQVRSRLESMSTLTITGSLLALKETELPPSTLPLYLRDTGDAGELTQFTERAQGEEEDDSDEGLHMEDEGKLEFASMFDTLHAQTHPEDPKPSSSAVQEDLNRVYRTLLRVWALALSPGGAVQQRDRLLRYTLLCVVRLVNLLRVRDSISRKNRGSWVTHALRVLRSLLSFLPWDGTRGRGDSCLSVALELARRFVDVFLPLSSSDSPLSSQNFSAAVLVLQEVSQSVNLTYSLRPRAAHRGEDGRVSGSSDVFGFQLPHEDTDAETIKVTTRGRNQPSKRLVVVWRDVYRQALRYQSRLRRSRAHSDADSEHEKMSDIMAQVQQALQTSGDRLQESHALRTFTGERHFISGEYTDSVRVWRAELCAERERDGPARRHLETRFCLALLYSHLQRYELREAQGLCDRMARRLQPHAGRQEEEMSGLADECVFEGRCSGPVGREAACAVVRSLGRFMAAYFTNRPLCILPAHSVDVLPPLHLPQAAGRRVVQLRQSSVVEALRSQHLSDVWTVDYGLELLLLGGLLPEAAWMAHHLGDWKMTATLSLAYCNYCGSHSNTSSLRWRELHLPSELRPAVVFQRRLEMLLGRVDGCEGREATDSCVEDVELLQASVQEILKASVMAEVDVFSQPLTRLLDSAKERATSLPLLTPAGFYLPAPPLYCPQPSPNTQDAVRRASVVLERDSRCRVSVLVQKFLLLLRASRCSLPAAQWYISRLHHCRLLRHKIRKKTPGPDADLIPEGLKKFSSRHGFFQSGPSKDTDSVTVQTIVCFRELCALCWMLHARDQLSVSCRRYQTLRSQNTDAQLDDVSAAGSCAEALRWACRLLPFCRFLNAEEALQDLVLSLVAELPPSRATAETLARVFPDEEESVRVPLREKFTSLVQRLRPVFVPDASTAGSEREDVAGETMMVLIQDQLRRRRRELRRVGRGLCAVVEFLWEREEEEEEERGGASLLKRLSLGASLSDSTLTDCGRPLVCSEGDTNETLSPDLKTKCAHSSKSEAAPDRSTHEREGEKRSDSSEPKGSGVEPVVGSWEFELEDEEFTVFLELFLSYVLEKDRLDAEAELPLLSSFSKQLRAKELHSVTFDMLTALKRRQRDGHQTGGKRGARLPLFRAGRCFQTLPVTPKPPRSTGPALPVQSHAQISTNTASAQALPGLLNGKQRGLFGLRRQATLASVEAKVSLIGSEIPAVPRGECRAFKILSQAELDVQVQLDSALEARFPQLARLLEWMMRWADRRALLSQPIRAKAEGGSDSVVIRARASTPAVLWALELLEQRHSAAPLDTSESDTRVESRCSESESPAPAMPSVTDRRRDRSGDTGRPSSADTPIIPPANHSWSHDVFEADQMDSHLSGEEDVISDPQNNGADVREEIRPTAASDDDESSVDDVTEASWLSSNQSRPPREAKDQTLTLAELQCSHTDDPSTHSQSEGNHVSRATPDRDAPADARRREASDIQPAGPSSSHPTPAEVPVRSERQSAGHPTGTDPPHGRAETHADPVRQLLQDELFRLVQLQQINFMSLMQVVGASFSNPPLSRLDTLQSNVNLPQISAQPPRSEPTRAACDSAERPARASGAESRGNGGRHGESDNRPNSASALKHSDEGGQRDPPLRTQEIQPLTIRSDWPQDGPADGRSFIPTSQGLLTTAHAPAAPQTGPGGVPDARLPFAPGPRPAPSSHGLKLLQLQPAQPVLLRPAVCFPVREAWGPNPHLTSAPGLSGQHRPSPVRRAEDTGGRWTEPAPPSHLHTSGCDTERTRGTAEALRLPPAPHRRSPAVGLPLLRFHPEAQPPVTLPRIPQHSGGIAGICPRLQLLHTDPDPPAAGFIHTPQVQTPRLIPLEQLLRWAAGKQTGAETKLQLLKIVNTQKIIHTSSPSSKRQKRREEKNKDEKIGVTFRPEESIIPPDEIVAPAEEASDQNDGDVVPLGTFDSEDIQTLLAKTYCTSAELHAYASTQKRPPDSQDACTNTEAEGPSPSITDQTASAQRPSSPTMPSAPRRRLVDVAPVVPPDVFLNLRFSREKPPDQPDTRRLTESHADIISEGRRFIHVIDLADEAPPQTPSPPVSSAQLHLLAASVVNPAPDSAPERMTSPTEELPGASVSEAVLGGDPVALSVLSGVRTPAAPLERALMSRSQISARLSEMDSQLLRLQIIADHMDGEFASTRLLVNTIDTRHPAVMPGVDRGPYSRPLRASQEVKNDDSSAPSFGPSAVQEAEEEILSSTVRNQSSAPGEDSPPAVELEQRRQETNQDLTGSLLEDAGTRADETLGLTGLSDVKDILSELISDGALTRSALGLTHRGSRTSGRSEVKRGGVMMEEERRDLRVWMRRRQRERLREYHKQRKEKREGERRPFTSPLTHNPTCVDLTTHQRIKEERDKMVLQEHYEQRARDACSLISDLLTTPINLPAEPQHSLRSRSQSSVRNKKIPKSHTGPQGRSALGQTVVYPRKSTTKAHGSLSIRLGLHRPASALPGDRLSQVTRRGMLPDPNARQGAQRIHQHDRQTLKNGLQSSTVKDQKPAEDTDERDAMSPWSPSAEVNRILGLENKQGFEEFDEGSTDVVGLEDISDSTGSILSKLDWAAIEKIVAEEEDEQ